MFNRSPVGNRWQFWQKTYKQKYGFQHSLKRTSEDFSVGDRRCAYRCRGSTAAKPRPESSQRGDAGWAPSSSEPSCPQLQRGRQRWERGPWGKKASSGEQRGDGCCTSSHAKPPYLLTWGCFLSESDCGEMQVTSKLHCAGALAPDSLPLKNLCLAHPKATVLLSSCLLAAVRSRGLSWSCRPRGEERHK